MGIKHGPVVLATRDAGIGAVVSHALESLGTHAPRLSSVSNMAECLAAVRLLRPSVVLLDDAVTDTPGARLLAQLQETQPGLRIVYIASQHSLDLEREVRRQGVLLYVAQPVESEALESTLVSLLQGLLRSAG